MPDSWTYHRRAPAQLVLVRHGESVGNVADQAARAQGAHRLALETRDADTPLSDIGRIQAEAVGRWIADLEHGGRPSVVLSSPFERSVQTAQIALAAAGLADRLVLDERLRERDLGILDRFTGVGIRAELPGEAARRDDVGKFYYRPPGGESWTDVVLRVRSVLADIRAEYHDERVWVFSHQAVIMSFRYVLESLDEQGILAIDRHEALPNCAVSTYHRTPEGTLTLTRYADTQAVQQSTVPTTQEPSSGSGAVDHA